MIFRFKLKLIDSNMKRRKPDDSPVSSESKIPRQDGGGDGTGHWEQKPGMILEVKMRNFMCHQVNILVRIFY